MIEKTFLYQEIQQQPDVLALLLQQEDENIRRLAAAIQEENITHIVIIGGIAFFITHTSTVINSFCQQETAEQNK